MTSKIRIKMGQIEVEYEGSEQFLKKELHELLEAVSKLYHESGEAAGEDETPKEDKVSRKAPAHDGKVKGTTATIAAKLGCKDGAAKELLVAAAARLTFIADQEAFTRKELLKEAQSAKAYYRRSVNNNLTNTLARLVKDGDFTETATDTYALTATKSKELESKLAS